MALSTSSSSRTHRRARSHSSTPTMSPQHDTWRFSHKRSHHTHSSRFDTLPGPSSTHTSEKMFNQQPEKWDVDLWRRGKKPRPDHEQSGNKISLEGVRRHFMPISDRNTSLFTANFSSKLSETTTSLPSTSDAFQFFPRKASASSKMMVDEESAIFDRSRSWSNDLHQLHTDAFDDLRRTVAETGEGFVKKMREWEEQRSSTDLSVSSGALPSKDFRKRGRKRPSTSFSAHEAEDSEDTDIQLMSSASVYSNKKELMGINPAKRRRALSLGRMDLTLSEESDTLHFAEMHDQERERSSSPFFHDYSASVCTSDDDDLDFNDLSRSQLQSQFRDTCATTPPLSFTFTNSANSSLISLPLPPASASTAFWNSAPNKFSSESTSKGAIYAPRVGASRSERAVAALSLALANGAGSMSDYTALLSAQGAMAAEDRQAGELWA